MSVTMQTVSRTSAIETLRRTASEMRARAAEHRTARDRAPLKIETIPARQQITAAAILAEQDADHLDRAANILTNLNRERAPDE